MRVGVDLDEQSMTRAYSVFQPLIPMLQGRGIKITLRFSPYKWDSLPQNNETPIVLSDIVDNSTARLITELSREISGLRIEVRGVPVQLQDLAKERSETEDEEKTDDKVDKEDISVGTQYTADNEKL